jgi:hypothetical protein
LFAALSDTSCLLMRFVLARQPTFPSTPIF